MWKLFLSISALALTTWAAMAANPSFTVGWSIYVGWNPYYYMQKSGILKKWADKYNVDIKVQRFDYAPSLDAFVAKNIEACTMTNMEALDMPAASGVDTTAVIVGDYSNGNDAVMVRNNLNFGQMPGKQVMLVQKTVSEYLFERGMVMNGQQNELKKVRLLNTSDSDIVAAFMNNPSSQVVVTWKPLVSQVRAIKGVTTIFDSSKIPGEILDLLVIRTDVLNRPDGSGSRFAKAMTGAWYETMAQLFSQGPAADKAATGIAAASGDTLASFKEQLSTTHLFYTPQSAQEFTLAPDLKTKMDLVRKFCFSHGLLGEKTSSVDDVAIQYPDKSVQGRKDRVRLRLDASYVQMAAQGKL
jgi:NitT/TauT family transport system substrate-binding protein